MRWRNLMGMVLALACTQGQWEGTLSAQGRASNASAPTGPGTAAPSLRVEVEPRIELLSLIFRLAGNREYNQPRVKSYAEDAQAQFGTFREHPVVRLARELRQSQGVSYDAVMGMAVHLSDAEPLQLRTPLEPWPESLDQRWTAESASNFVVAARQFVKESRFAEFAQKHQSLYTTTAQRLQALLKEKGHLEWFDAYFGARPGATFTVVPGLLNGGCCYGPHFTDANGRQELYCILGVWKTDQAGLPLFTEDMLDTVVHEFCHSYANPLILRHQAQLQGAGEALFEVVGTRMRAQAYGNAQTMLYESLVRACTCRYVRQFQGVDKAQAAVQRQKASGFLWMPELTELLADYEAQRSTYPTLEDFMPRLVSFFQQYAQGFAAGQTYAQRSGAGQKPEQHPAPKVVSMTPANGATNVDASLTEIRVQFDRPMRDESWSMCGDGPNFPELVGRPHYEPGRTNWVVAVKLKPNWDYGFGLNSASFENFRSAEGVPLEPILVTFRTGEAKK